MGKMVVDLTKKIADYLRAVIAEELKSMDAFYQQFD